MTVRNLKVTKLTQTAQIPTRAYDGDAGLDLYSAEALTLAPGERNLVATGIALEIPPGHAGLILPRSGLALKHGITLVNTPGLIDAGYRGEIKIIMLNTDADNVFEINIGDRIAQLLIIGFAELNPIEVTQLSPAERSASGFGSSGKR